ncbi:hypothetical protein RJ639_011249 [Escallonia herrerae]|uniref:squalene monooxygenase n=1 Tax=Escallonia herrerae TaxID=1293975 RepID=A0AA88VML8_9ASTE|nr:hypothetical protein RJ639_011249 [Escallonia herrerae]
MMTVSSGIEGALEACCAGAGAGAKLAVDFSNGVGGSNDVIIVGAGVAGSALAYTLGKDGRQVHVIERNTSMPNRIVGELLQPGGYLKLIELGLDDCLNGVDAQRVHGYAFYKNGKSIRLPYPSKNIHFDQGGRSFNNGRFVQKLREKAASLPKYLFVSFKTLHCSILFVLFTSVKLEQGTVTSLVEERGRVRGVRYKTKAGLEMTAFAPLTIVCDGCFSRLRHFLCKPKVEKPSHFVALLLENCQLPHPNLAHAVLGDPCSMVFYPISSSSVRFLLDYPGQKLPSVFNGGMARFLKAIVAPQIPPELHSAFILAIDKGQIRTMPASCMPAAPYSIPGALLLGDALNMRHPIVGGGMTVALCDIVLLRDLLRPLTNLNNSSAMAKHLELFYTKRKPVAFTLNTIAAAFYKVACDCPEEAREEIHQACFDYMSLGSIFSKELVALTSGLNTLPLNLDAAAIVFHMTLDEGFTEDSSFVVGQEFPDVKTFRKAIKEAAIAQHFEIRLIKSDLIRYFAKCASEGCPWRIRAVKLTNSPTFTIRSIGGTHTCGRNAQNGHHQASVDWIVSFIEERLRENINYKPKDILCDIRKEYGITIPYKQAWRAKERGLQAIYGSSEEGYYLLPSYCEQIKKANPGSIAELSTIGADNRFQRLFVSFYASIYGFLNGCLPIVGLGAVQLKSKYLGTLLSATSFDADGGLFPLAFGVVDVENDESWMWFLSELLRHSRLRPRRCSNLLFYHMDKKLKNSRIGQLLWKAAYSTTASGFKEKLAEIEEISSDASKWLRQFPPSLWALVYFEGTRYGHLTSNIEEFNRWILEARELPVIQVIERIHTKSMAEFEERRSNSNSWFSVLAPSAEKRMMEAMSHASTYQVLRSDEVEFEVLSAGRSDIVNIGTHSCSCRNWQLYGIPCSHAVAALVSCKKDVYAFTEKCFTVANYRETYSQEIHPIPGKIEWKREAEMPFDDDTDTRLVRPPKFRRPPGRPEKKRICVEYLNREKHTVHCSRCNQSGHYKTTCKADTMKGGIEQY